MYLVILEDRVTPSITDWWAGWPESMLQYGHGIDDSTTLRVWVEDRKSIHRVAELLSPISKVAVTHSRPPHLTVDKYISVFTAGDWLELWGAKGLSTYPIDSPVQNNLMFRAVFVGVKYSPDTRAITTAHEVGHMIGAGGHTSDPTNIMYGGGTTLSSVNWSNEQLQDMDRVIGEFLGVYVG